MLIFLGTLAALLINIIIFFAFDASSNYTLGFGESLTDPNSWLRTVVSAICVLLGMFAQILTTRIQADKGTIIDIGAHLKMSYKSKDFWLAALISPFIVGVATQAASQQSNLGLVALIAFQNGFFFRSVFDTQKRRLSRA